MKLLSGITSFLTSFAVVSIVYHWFAKDLFALLSAVYMTGLVIGIAHGLLYPQKTSAPVFIGAFTAILGLWSPIIIGTYGFAILGVPVLIIYALCAAIGTHLALRAKRRMGLCSVPRAEERISGLNERGDKSVGHGSAQSRGRAIFIFFSSLIGWFLSLLYVAANGDAISYLGLQLHPLLGSFAFSLPQFLIGSCAGVSLLLAHKIVQIRNR